MGLCLVLLSQVALIFGPQQFLIVIIAKVVGLVEHVTDSVVLIQFFPPIRALGDIAAVVMTGADPR